METQKIYQLYNSFPVEHIPFEGKMFVWLKPEQVIRFPFLSNELRFDLAWAHNPFQIRTKILY